MDITGKPQRSHSPHNHVPSTTTFNKKKPRKTSLSSSTSSKLALLHALEEIRLRRVWKESKPVDSVRNHQPGGARRKANQCGRGGAERSIGRIRVRSCAPVANGLMCVAGGCPMEMSGFLHGLTCVGCVLRVVGGAGGRGLSGSSCTATAANGGAPTHRTAPNRVNECALFLCQRMGSVGGRTAVRRLVGIASARGKVY